MAKRFDPTQPQNWQFDGFWVDTQAHRLVITVVWAEAGIVRRYTAALDLVEVPLNAVREAPDVKTPATKDEVTAVAAESTSAIDDTTQAANAMAEELLKLKQENAALAGTLTQATSDLEKRIAALEKATP